MFRPWNSESSATSAHLASWGWSEAPSHGKGQTTCWPPVACRRFPSSRLGAERARGRHHIPAPGGRVQVAGQLTHAPGHHRRGRVRDVPASVGTNRGWVSGHVERRGYCLPGVPRVALAASPAGVRASPRENAAGLFLGAAVTSRYRRVAHMAGQWKRRADDPPETASDSRS